MKFIRRRYIHRRGLDRIPNACTDQYRER